MKQVKLTNKTKKVVLAVFMCIIVVSLTLFALNFALFKVDATSATVINVEDCSDFKMKLDGKAYNNPYVYNSDRISDLGYAVYTQKTTEGEPTNINDYDGNYSLRFWNKDTSSHRNGGFIFKNTNLNSHVALRMNYTGNETRFFMRRNGDSMWIDAKNAGSYFINFTPGKFTLYNSASSALTNWSYDSTLLNVNDKMKVTFGVVTTKTGNTFTDTVSLTVFNETQNAEVVNVSFAVNELESVYSGNENYFFVITHLGYGSNAKVNNSVCIEGINRPIIFSCAEKEYSEDFVKGEMNAELSSINAPEGYVWADKNAVLKNTVNKYKAFINTSAVSYYGNTIYKEYVNINVCTSSLKNIEDVKGIDTIIGGAGGGWSENHNADHLADKGYAVYTHAKQDGETYNINEYNGNYSLLFSDGTNYKSGGIFWKTADINECVTLRMNYTGNQTRFICRNTVQYAYPDAATDNYYMFMFTSDSVKLMFGKSNKLLTTWSIDSGNLNIGDRLKVTYGVCTREKGNQYEDTANFILINETKGKTLIFSDFARETDVLYSKDNCFNIATHLAYDANKGNNRPVYIAGIERPIYLSSYNISLQNEFDADDSLNTITLADGYSFVSPMDVVREGANDYAGKYSLNYFGKDIVIDCKISLTGVYKYYYITIKDVNGSVLKKDAIKQGEKYTLTDYDDGKIFIGYQYDNKLYKKSSELTLTSDIEITLLSIDFSVLNECKVRMNNNEKGEYGLRYTLRVNAEDYKNVSKYVTSIGAIICPTDLLANDFTLNNQQVSMASFVPDKLMSGSGDIDLHFSLVTIKSHNFNREFSGRGYIKLNCEGGENVIYTDYSVNNSHSVVDVAKDAIANYNKQLEQGNKIYSDADLAILKKYVNSTVEVVASVNTSGCTVSVLNGEDGTDFSRDYSITSKVEDFNGTYRITLTVLFNPDATFFKETTTAFSLTVYDAQGNAQRIIADLASYENNILTLTFNYSE